MIDRRRVLVGIAALGAGGCAPRGSFTPAPGATAYRTRRMLLATNRRSLTASARGDRLRWFDLAVSMPEDRAPGAVPVSRTSAFGTERISPLTAMPRFGPPRGEPLVIWVHGYNNTAAEAVYRHVQMAEDIGMNGPQVSFVWPSDASGGGYIHDRDSVLDARRPLAEVLASIRRNWSGEVLIVAHSLGVFLVMESLTRLAMDGTEARRVADGLVFLQPDIDPDVFREQVRDAGRLPARSVVVLAEDDRALRISGRLAQTGARVGNTVGSVPEGFRVIDLTGVDDAGTSHLVALSSPRVLSALRRIYASGTS